jgi:prephenate dehydratase
MSTIAFLGPRGTYTEEAARYLFGKREDVELKACRSIADCLFAAEHQQVKGCVVPVENSIEGSVNVTSDLLAHEVQLPIRAEVTVPISHTLYVGQQHVDPAQVEFLYSHPQAIAQCRKYIRHRLPQAQIVETSSTASACLKLKEEGASLSAAIGPQFASSIYGLVEVERNIQDYDNNFTRFIYCSKDAQNGVHNQSDLESAKLNARQKPPLPGAASHKTSILVTLPADFPGALHQVLAAFAWRKMNLTRIESRPTKKELFNYLFFIDIDHTLDDVLVPGAIAEIKALGCQVRVLGSYPVYWKEG